jgi:hypothetical protein
VADVMTGKFWSMLGPVSRSLALIHVTGVVASDRVLLGASAAWHEGYGARGGASCVHE